jgi:hypothetical protein
MLPRLHKLARVPPASEESHHSILTRLTLTCLNLSKTESSVHAIAAALADKQSNQVLEVAPTGDLLDLVIELIKSFFQFDLLLFVLCYKFTLI